MKLNPTAVTGLASMSLALGLASAPALSETPKNTLVVVPHADLRILDPLQAAATITIMHASNIYDELFAWDKELQPKPQMVGDYQVSADKLTYTMSLRPGLKFHDGTAVTTKDVVASVDRWMKRDGVGKKLAEVTASFTATDDKTFVFKLKQPYSWVEYSLGNHAGNYPAIMREKEAKTDPMTAVTETIGSGPYKFSKEEWKPGAEVVYTKNTDYVPRSDPPDAMAGAKLVKVDKMIWKIIPDAQTSASALIAGEVDLIDSVNADVVPLLEKNKDVVVSKIPPVGGFGAIRPNALNPPFNNAKARQALWILTDQEDYMRASFGEQKWWNKCFSYFVCGSIYGTTAGSEGFQKADPARAKKMFEEAGYKGEKIIITSTKEIQNIGTQAEVLAGALRNIGANVDIEWADWGTTLTRFLTNKNPVGQSGGWSIFTTTNSWSTWHNPLTNVGVILTPEGSWAGWPSDELGEKLRTEFIQAQDKASRMAALDKLSKRMWEVAPYVVTGQFDGPYAWRKNVVGVLPTSKLALWNIGKE
ncbi:MAG: ABC transporter substrate-binding protein [Proteobacteria bacterium]|nr:ABC transporter substrate-binding protein [Pseudomonadota bacterium]MBI3497857.1 ABC transporter substrate-binding protein [Pseudomonadota bacterium]